METKNMDNGRKWVFHESVIWDDARYTSHRAALSIADAESMTLEEVYADRSEESLLEIAADMKYDELSEELDSLISFFDEDCSSNISYGQYPNPNMRNRVLVRGSAGRWDGTSHGISMYPDLAAALDTSPNHYGKGNVFADCEFRKIWDENGSLFINGAHHDGSVRVEVRQLSDEGEALIDEIEYEGGLLCIPDEGIDAMGRHYGEGSEDELIHDLWNDPSLCCIPRYVECRFGAEPLIWIDQKDSEGNKVAEAWVYKAGERAPGYKDGLRYAVAFSDFFSDDRIVRFKDLDSVRNYLIEKHGATCLA